MSGARHRRKGDRIERELVDRHKALFLRRNNADPLVLLPWRIWARILERVRS